MSDDFSITLSEWVAKELEYDGPLTGEMLAKLGHGRAAPVMKYLVRRVRSKRNVETILGNIMLHSTEKRPTPTAIHLCPPPSTLSSADRNKLLAKRERLLHQVEHLKAAKRQMMVDSATLQKSLMEKEHEVDVHRRRIGDCRQQTALLEQQALCCAHKLQSLGDICTQLKTLASSHRARAKAASNTQYSSVSGGGGAGNTVEPVHLQETRAVIQQTKEFLSKHYQSRTDDRRHDADKKQTVWTNTELLCNSTSASVVLSSVESLAEKHGQQTVHQTRHLDLQSDSQQLRLQGDGSTSLNVSNTLQNLIQASQAQHIEQFSVTQRLMAQARAQQQALLALLQQYQQLQQKTLASQPHLMHLSRALIVAELERAGAVAELAQWQSLLNHDKELCARRRQERENLVSAHQQISQFSGVVDEKQSLIARLVNYNSTACERLTEQQGKVQRYIQTSLLSHQSDISAGCAVLRDQLLQSARALLKLPLDRLLVDQTNESVWFPVCDMLIHRLNNPSTSGAGHHKGIVQAVRFPSLKLSDGLLQHVCDLLAKSSSKQRHLYVLKAACRKASSRQSQQQIVADHLVLSSSLDDRYRTELLPQLNTMSSHCSECLSKCMHVQQLIEEWCEQPAQFVVPWSTYHNLNVQQWTEQFIVLATKWHQKRLLN